MKVQERPDLSEVLVINDMRQVSFIDCIQIGKLYDHLRVVAVYPNAPRINPNSSSIYSYSISKLDGIQPRYEFRYVKTLKPLEIIKKRGNKPALMRAEVNIYSAKFRKVVSRNFELEVSLADFGIVPTRSGLYVANSFLMPHELVPMSFRTKSSGNTK